MNKVSKVLLLVLSFVALFSLTYLFNTKPVHADTYGTIDCSEYQGNFTATKVKALKQEFPFIILRVGYGNTHEDNVFAHNAALCKKYNLPFAVYNFSLYTSPSDARSEAKVFYERSHAYNPIAYFNDHEVNYAGYASNSSTIAWYKELNSLTSKPIGYYSYVSFRNTYAPTAYKYYDNQWIAAYSSVSPQAGQALWQNTDAYYTPSLGQSVDHSNILTSVKSLSYWLGSSSANKIKNTYVNGGYRVKDKVVLNKTATKFYNPSGQTIAGSVKGHEYTVKEVQSVKTGTSNQAVLLTNQAGQPIGWVLAQDVHYPNSYLKVKPKGNTLVSLTKLNEYKDRNFVTRSTKSIAKNTVFHIKGMVKSTGGATRFVLDNGYYISGNAKYVQVTTPYITELNTAKYVKAYTGIKAYKTANLTGVVKGKGHYKGTVFSVKKVVVRSDNKNQYSLELSNGYYTTAYRANVRNTTKALSSTTKTYTIKSGDSLWAIAYNHGITLTKLESLNGLSNNSFIYPGQQLKLS